MERLSGRSRLNAAKTVDKGFRAAVKMPGERILVEAANLKALAGVGTTAFPDWQQSSTGPLVSIQLLSVEHSAQPSSNAVEHAPVLELPE